RNGRNVVRRLVWRERSGGTARDAGDERRVSPGAAATDTLRQSHLTATTRPPRRMTASQTPDGTASPGTRPRPRPRRGGGGRVGSTHTRLVALLSVAIVIVMLGIAATLDRRQRYNEEIGRLRAAMTEVERERTDALLAEEAHRFDVSLALLRRQARLDGR